MPHQPPGPPLPDPTGPTQPEPPPAPPDATPTDPAALATRLHWPLGIQCAGAVDCPMAALDRTLALLETTRGSYHLLVTTNRYTRGRSLWLAWLPRETGVLTLIDEQPEGQIEQALDVIAQHLDAGQPE